MITINVLGRLEILPYLRLPKKGRALLAYLAVEGRSERDRLADLLWPYQDSEHALHSLRNLLLEIRKSSIGDDFGSDQFALWLNNYECDLRQLRDVTTPAKAGHLQYVSDLYRGPFMDGFSIASETFEQWHATQTRQVSREITDVLMRLTKSPNDGIAINAGRRLMEIDPLNEEGCQALIRAYLRAGNNRVNALRAYKRHAEALRDELDVGPSAETTALMRALAIVVPVPRERIAA